MGGESASVLSFDLAVVDVINLLLFEGFFSSSFEITKRTAISRSTCRWARSIPALKPVIPSIR